MIINILILITIIAVNINLIYIIKKLNQLKGILNNRCNDRYNKKKPKKQNSRGNNIKIIYKQQPKTKEEENEEYIKGNKNKTFIKF